MKKTQKTKIYFLTTIKTSIYDNKQINYNYNDKNLNEEIIMRKIGNKNGFYIIFNEFEIEEIEEKEKENENEKQNIKIYLTVSNLSNEDEKINKYEVIINYEPNRINFIFNLSIGNSVKTSILDDNRFESLNIDFNSNFQYFYDERSKVKENEADYIENLAKDSLNYLESLNGGVFEVYFEIIFFLLLYIKNLDFENSYIVSLLEIINLQQFIYQQKNYKKGEINKFIQEIFENLDKNDKAWPFNEFLKYDNKEDEENDEKLEKKEEKDLNISVTEIKFFQFLLGYYSKFGKIEDLKIFLINDTVKNKTLNVLSLIRNENIISVSCRHQFMKLFDDKGGILEKLQLELNLLNYFKIINENFYDFFELIEKVGMKKYNVDFHNISIATNIKEINEIHKTILEKEKEKNNFFLNFIPFIQNCINLFGKNDELNQLIYLDEFIEDEKQLNKNIEISDIKINLGKAIKKSVNDSLYIKSQKTKLYLLENIPKISQYISQKDMFQILENVNLNSKNNKENVDKIFEIIMNNKLYNYFEDKKNFLIK